jgi:hypothetical protein
VTETYLVIACGTCGVFWTPDAEPAQCSDAEHQHKRYQLHRHRSVVAFPDGTSVIGVSFDARDPYGRDQRPDYGLYLDHRWLPPWPHDHLDWPDFGLPNDVNRFLAALQSTLNRARAGDRVEVGCLGGHGRTGTALACLAVLSGVPSHDAIAWVRTNYCTEAIETAEQEALVLGLEG